MSKRNEAEEVADELDDILDRAWEEIPEPKTLPDGAWLLGGRNASYKKPSETQNGKVLFFYTPQRPMDVDAGGPDEDALTALGEDYDINENQVVYTVWIEFARDWDKVRKHLAKHGVSDESQSIRDSLKAFKNTEVVATLGTRSFENAAGETVYENTPSNFSAVE